MTTMLFIKRPRQVCSALVLILFLFSLSFTAGAQTFIAVKETTPPRNMVLVIVDGMGSLYVSPDGHPLALNQGAIRPAHTPVLHGILSEGLLIPHVTVPTPQTGPAHSVIITGYSGAEQDMVAYPGATIYDVLGREGFISIALMHKGDFSQLRLEQDVGLFSESNSVTDPILSLQVNTDQAPADLIGELESWKQRLPGYLEGTEGLDSYIAYETWELDASRHIVSFMADTHPDIRYIFTINVGVVDSAGHYRGVEGYLGSIAGFDTGLGPLYAAARDSNTALVITADHGMAFKSPDSPRGGHASEDYRSPEALTVPLFIVSPNVDPGELDQAFYQEDVAPTLLSIMDIPLHPRYADGKAIPVKGYANLWVSSDANADVEIIDHNEIISSGTGDNVYIFSGLKTKN